ncbi:MAG: SH3 domain-containing protein [Gammaproteobacteria bacterium]|nr:SH3 domain-containing protein [Gammaproteobacteria bacterium]
MRCPKGFLAASLALLLGGCSAEKRESAAAVSDAVAAVEKTGIQAAQNESDEALLKQKLARRSREVGRLQLQLLAKQAEINQLLSAHERALQEAVRAGAKLRGLDTRADAVAAIAEAALMIRNAKERARDDQQQALVHADKLLESSRREMKSGNLNAASYLAARASSLARPAADYGPGHATGEAETLFAVAIGMRVKKLSNVRELPEIDTKPLFQLAAGAEVRALGYSDLWIRVVTREQREGWIYYNLLIPADPDAAGE